MERECAKAAAELSLGGGKAGREEGLRVSDISEKDNDLRVRVQTAFIFAQEREVKRNICCFKNN